MATESRKKVWIAIQTGKGVNTTFNIDEAESYQAEAFYEFLESKSKIPINFKKEGHEFTIAPISTIRVRGLPGNEIAFLELLTGNNNNTILSNDLEGLQTYTTYQLSKIKGLRGGKRKSLKKRRSIKRKTQQKNKK